MSPVLSDLAEAIAASPLRDTALFVLSRVPGFPPVIQTIHILCVSAIMGSIVLIDLRVLGLALPSQDTTELTRRLMPWTWWALPVVALSGSVFVFARPHRYFANPVFGIKVMLLVSAVLLTVIFHLASVKDVRFWERSSSHRGAAKVIAALSLLLWIGVVLAGRWIAYADYLFAE